MKIFNCDEIVKGCPYVFSGASEEEVFENMMNHLQDNHDQSLQDLISKMTNVQLHEYLASFIKEA